MKKFPRVKIGQTVEIADQKYVFGQHSTPGFNQLAEFAEKARRAAVRRSILALRINMRQGTTLPTTEKSEDSFGTFDEIAFRDLARAVKAKAG